MDGGIQSDLTSQDIQIIEFLASGQSASETAGMVGVSLELVQSKLSDQVFRDHIKQRGAEIRSERVETKYAKTEERILDKLSSYANDDFAEIPSLVRALEVIAKNRVLYRNPAGLGAHNIIQQNNVVTLLLPERVKLLSQDVVLNPQGEIVAIGDRNMASMPIEGVKEIFKEIGKRHEQAIEIPTGSSSEAIKVA